jgi:MFS family permease
MTGPAQPRVVATLGATQTIAWASSYYLPAVLAQPIAHDLGLASSLVFGAFSLGLLVSGAIGPRVGRLIDRHGGRGVLAGSNLVLAAGLALLAAAQGPLSLFVAWLAIGIGIGAGLYDAAFATLVGIYGDRSRGAITGITLIAGFASTLGWPVSALLEDAYGWRAACLAWAVIHLVVCLPAHLLLLPAASGRTPATAARAATAAAPATRWQRALWMLAFVFASASFVAAAMGAHVLRLLEAMGATPAAALFAGMMIGPAQVAARVVEFWIARQVTPLASARVALALHPAGAAGLALFGAPVAAAPFAALHGAGNGLATIARGSLPLYLFGAHGYGELLGRIGGIARIAQALAPFTFGLAIDAWGGGALAITAGLMLASVAVLLAIRPPRCGAG